MGKTVKRTIAFMMVVLGLLGGVFSSKGILVKAAGSDIIRNDETGIPDKALYQLILKSLGKTTDSTFTEEEAQNVLGLEQDVFCEGDLDRKEEEQVVNLRGIEKLPNLRSVRLGRNKIANLNPLENLTNLCVLTLTYSYCITNIEGLRNCTRLTYLELPETVTDLSPIKNMTELTGLSATNSGICTLPDLTGHTKLTGFSTRLQGNNLTKKELTKKLPKQLVKDKAWMKQVIDLQEYNIRKMGKSLRVASPKKVTKITSRTKKIIGKAGKNTWVKLCTPSRRYIMSKWIKGALPDKKGVFKMKNLKLKKYKNKTLWLELYYKNRYYKSDVLIQRLTFKLKK